MTGPADAAQPAPPVVAADELLDTAEAGHRVVTGGVLRLAGYGIGLVASLAGAAVMLRYLGTAEYGRFATVTALVTAIQLVTDLGMSALGVREYSQRTGADRDRFMRGLLGMRLMTTVLLVGVATAWALARGYDQDMVVGTVLMGFAAGLAALTGTIAIPLQAEIRMGVITSIDVARQVGTAAAFILLSVAGAGIVAFLGVSAPIYALVLFATYLFARGGMPLRPTFHPREWMALLRPTLIFALATGVGGLYIYTAMVLTEVVADEIQTGYFAAAFRVFMIVATFPALLAGTAFPLLSRAARDDHDRLRYANQRLFEGSAILGGAALIGLVLGAEVVMDVLGGDDFDPAAGAMRIQGVALAVTFLMASFGFTLLALHRHRAIIFANLAALTISAVMVLALARSHGAEGASLGVLLGESTLAIGYLIALATSKPNLAPTPGYAVRVLPPLAAGLACWFLPLPPLGVVTAGLLVYAAGLLVCRAIPSEVFDAIPGRRPALTDESPEQSA